MVTTAIEDQPSFLAGRTAGLPTGRISARAQFGCRARPAVGRPDALERTTRPAGPRCAPTGAKESGRSERGRMSALAKRRA